MSKQILMGITACLFVQVVHMNTHAEDWESAVQAGPQEKQIYERPIQTQNTWERSETNLIWNFHNMYQPCIVETPATDYPYLMWFFGWSTTDTNPDVPGCDAIYHARSKDLVSWEIWCGNNSWDTNMQPATWAPVLTASNRFYDEWHNGDPSVVLMDGMFYMAYSATSNPRYKESIDHLDGMLLCIMGATSPDGIHWEKTQAPLLIENEDARTAPTTNTQPCDFHRPSLMRHEGKWRLWFDYWNHPSGVCMGYAENTNSFDAPDGFKITHDLQEQPLIKNWPNPDVIFVDGRYLSFADPTGYPPTQAHNSSARSWSSRAMCEAVSDDGMNWRIMGYIPPDKDAAACHVAQALVTQINGERRLYVFYATQRGGVPEYDYRYDRIRSIWRKL